jgi:hypothetical protein
MAPPICPRPNTAQKTYHGCQKIDNHLRKLLDARGTVNKVAVLTENSYQTYVRLPGSSEDVAWCSHQQ